MSTQFCMAQEAFVPELGKAAEALSAFIYGLESVGAAGSGFPLEIGVKMVGSTTQTRLELVSQEPLEDSFMHPPAGYRDTYTRNEFPDFPDPSDTKGWMEWIKKHPPKP